MGKYHICKWSNRYNCWSITAMCFDDIDKARNYMRKYYGRTTEYTVKFVQDGKIA